MNVAGTTTCGQHNIPADTLIGAGRKIMGFFRASPVSARTELVLRIASAVEAQTTMAATVRPRWETQEIAETSPRPDPHYVPVGRCTTLAREILSNALRRYRQPDGYEGTLVEAAWQLELIGRDAWPALLEVSPLPESEFFLGSMVRLEGVQDDDRRSALLAAAKNADQNVRSRLLELLDEIPVRLKRELVIALAGGKNLDDPVTDRARDLLTALES